MKKVFSVFSFVLICLVFLCGCERKPMVVSFQNTTMAGSDQNTINISFADDKKFDEKFFDIWIKSDTDNTKLSINKSNEEGFEVTIIKKDIWRSITTLANESKGLVNKEDYNGYKNAVEQTYIFKTNTKCNITFKAVTGDKVKNADETGFILINCEDVSKEYTQELTPLKNK